MGVVLFSGHMVDAPGRRRPRFPPEHVPTVRRSIAEAVASIEGADVWAVSGLACGGDLLFADEWLATARRLRAYLPRPEAGFLDESVRFAGAEWEDLFRATTASPIVEVVGPDADMIGVDDPHTPNSRRMLEAALGEGGEIHGLFLWDGEGGDGPGGTGELVSAVRGAGGKVRIIPP